MESRLFTADSYLRAGDAFHFARKTIEVTAPQILHHHDFYEIFLIEKGSAHHYVNGSLEHLGPGTMCFMRPDDSHALTAVGERGCQIMNIVVRPETADHLVARYPDDVAGQFFWTEDPLPATYVVSGPRLERATNAALELQTERRSLARIEEYLLTVMTRIVEVSESPRSRLPGWLMRACARARSPAVFREGAAGFVAAAGRGHEHVCRQMKAHLGMTPSAFINRVRMEFAAMALSTTDRPIDEIAESCGIENLSHFYRVFRRHYGVTPRAYRLEHADRAERARG